MKKVKIYVVVCSYTTDGQVANVELSKMLERLQIKSTKEYWGVNHRLDALVRWNVDKCHKVRYQVMTKMINEEYLNNISFDSSRSITYPKQLERYLNDAHDKMLMSMSRSQAEIKLRKYGNDYSKQC